MLPGSIGPMASVFTKIIDGEIPGRFIYRDADVAAFLTIEPVAYGHTLVVPVAEVDRWTDMDPELWAKVNAVAQHIGQAVIRAFDAPRAGYLIAGFEVPHAHIHVFPAADMSGYDLSRAMRGDDVDQDKMEDAASKLRAELRQAGVSGVAARGGD
ncbi:HIT-like protein [Corynebacterium heidelbergense]|nr:HIT-like protein [Corynebacterium heidelbergense]